ncbi:MAG: TIGR00266 family protein [Anaerolineae bacterium]|nr:TIGR00266 family protein [Anaerolineae bacterium]
MRCPNCQAEVPEGKRFCANCGSPMPAPSEEREQIIVHQRGGRIDLPDPAVSYTGQGKSGLKYNLIGTTLQAVTLQLTPGHTVVSESGGMAWMSANVNMETKATGGIGKAIGRLFTGESLFLVEYEVSSGQGIIAFASEFPGKVVPIDLAEGQSVIAQKDAFMCAEKSVDVALHFRKKLGAGFFGGEGFIMQKFTGPGLAFMEFDGEIVEYTLEAGQTLMVDTGYVAMYEPTVDFDIEMVRGIKNIFFGGEGLFLARLRGPGRVWLQTMPIYNLARKIASHIHTSGGSDTSTAGGDIAKGVIKGLMGG